MKVLVIVALFAFVAVQVCQSAPVPEDDKTDKVDKKDEPAVPAVAAPVDVAAAVTTETKSESVSSDAAVAKTPEAEAHAPTAEAKKD